MPERYSYSHEQDASSVEEEKVAVECLCIVSGICDFAVYFDLLFRLLVANVGLHGYMEDSVMF